MQAAKSNAIKDFPLPESPKICARLSVSLNNKLGFAIFQIARSYQFEDTIRSSGGVILKWCLIIGTPSFFSGTINHHRKIRVGWTSIAIGTTELTDPLIVPPFRYKRCRHYQHIIMPVALSAAGLKQGD